METELEREIRRRKRIEEMKKARRRAEWLRKWGAAAGVSAVVLAGGIFGIVKTAFPRDDGGGEGPEAGIIAIQDFSKEAQDGQTGGETPLNGGGDNAISGEENRGMPSGASGDAADSLSGNTARRKGGNRAASGSGLPRETAAMPGISGPDGISAQEAAVPLSAPVLEGQVLKAEGSGGIVDFDENVFSQYGVLINVEDSAILAGREAFQRMNPASMTKILTVLVAAEHLTEKDLDKTVPITIDITDYCFVNQCSITGYERDEEVPVRDLFYGTILPSGADAALALAGYVAGSHEAFVDMMNEKLEQLGISETTHFTNCVGLYDENHYSTAYDMAVILKAAADNVFCRQVLSAHTYKTVATQQHPEGLLISNWFLRRIEDRDTHGEVLCAKTGFVDQSGSRAASLSRGNDGKEYVCVTAGSYSSWGCIADQVELYQKFIPGGETSGEPGGSGEEGTSGEPGGAGEEGTSGEPGEPGGVGQN